MAARDARDPRLPREDDQVEDDPHEQLERVSKRSSAMKAVVSIVVAIFLAGAAVSAWLSLFETRSHADKQSGDLRAEVAQSKVDCDKRLRAVEDWRIKSDERDRWMQDTMRAVARKLEVVVPPPPAPPLDGLRTP